MLAIVGGTGRLPGLVIEALVAQGEAPVLAELHGHPIEGRGDLPVMPFRLEQLGMLIADLVSSGVTRVCFAGAVRRPTFDPGLVDAATAPLLQRIAAALGGGDDSALRAVATLFQEAGLTPVAAHELRADLLPEAGVLGTHTPTDTHPHVPTCLAPPAAAPPARSCWPSSPPCAASGSPSPHCVRGLRVGSH